MQLLPLVALLLAPAPGASVSAALSGQTALLGDGGLLGSPPGSPPVPAPVPSRWRQPQERATVGKMGWEEGVLSLSSFKKREAPG